MERLLNRMITLGEKFEERRSSLSPPRACYTIAMDAWSRSQREVAVENVERVFSDAEHRGFRPTTYMYTTLINSLAHSDHIVDAPERAKAILVKMKADFERSEERRVGKD